MTQTNQKDLDTAFDHALNVFVADCQKLINEYFFINFKNLHPPVLSIKRGKRYARIVYLRHRKTGYGVYVFVDMTNGDVLKAASWKAPAKHARSNIFDADNGMSGVTVYGGAYLR